MSCARGGTGPNGGPPEHELRVAEADEVREIRVAARKLLDLHLRVRDAELAAQIAGQALPVEVLAGAHRPGIAHFILTIRDVRPGKNRFSRIAQISFPPTRTSSLFFAIPSRMRGAAFSGSIAPACVASTFP